MILDDSTQPTQSDGSQGTKTQQHNGSHYEKVVFQVEETLFRLPKDPFLVPGIRFPARIPYREDTGPGTTDADPIHLTDVTEKQFRGFLLIVQPKSDPSMKYEQLMDALHLATLWRFKDVREKAISRLSRIIRARGSIETILLAKEYRIQEWLREGYIKLAQKEYLIIEDLRGGQHRLDWETVSRIFALHSILMRRAATWRKYSRVMSPQDIEKVTDSIFREEFSQMDQAQAEWEKCKCGVCRRASSC